MGNKNIIREFFSKIGWFIYWKATWQRNKEWKENFSPQSVLGKQIRDNLAYFIMYGLEDERNKKVDVNVCSLLNEIRNMAGIEILNRDDTITKLLEKESVLGIIRKYEKLLSTPQQS